jgi:hypothetical protein
MPAPKLQLGKQVRRFFSTPHDRPPKQLLMLTAYLDESGHEANDVVIIAGFLGNDEQWIRCAEEWKRGLGPQRKLLHMKDLRWSKFGTRKLLATLGGIPHACGLHAVMAGVRVTEYYDLVAGSIAEKLCKGYYFALIAIIDSILKNIPGDETVKLVLESQKEYEGSAHFIFEARDEVTPSGERKLSGIEYIPKESSLLTQPADYLAYAMLQGFRDRKSKKYQWCSPILRNSQVAYGIVPERDNIRRIIKNTLDEYPEFK